MYILKNKISNVKRFLIKNSDIIIINANKEILLNNRILNIDNLISASFLNTEIDIFLLLNLKNKKLMCDRNLKKLHQFKKNTLIYNEIVYQNQNNKLTSIDTQFNADGSIVYNWVILDILKNKIIKNLNLRDNILGFFYTYKDTIIYRTNNENDKISAFDYVNNKILWQLDLSKLGTFQDYQKEQQSYKVEKFIGIYQNELLVACNRQKLLSIDIQTGKLLQTWDDIPADKMQLDKQAGKLIGLSDFIYAEVDLSSRKILVKNIKTNIEKAGLRAFKGGRDMPFTGTHIFYTAYGRDKKTDYLFDAVIAFNRHTYKIDWMYRIDASVGTNSPKIAGNKLYQLDLDGNLYIFEKEENEAI